MSEGITNYAQLMKAFELTPEEIAKKTGADLSLISRWRTGSRKLMPGRHWVYELSDCFLEADGQSRNPILSALLSQYFPAAQLKTRKDLREALSAWLTAPGQLEPQYRLNVSKTLAKLLPAKTSDRKNKTQGAAKPINEVSADGINGARRLLIRFIDEAVIVSNPSEIFCVCGNGLEFFSFDPGFLYKWIVKLRSAFHQGIRIRAVLPSNFNNMGTAETAGPWLMGSLLGNMRTFFSPELLRSKNAEIIAAMDGQLALHLSYSENFRNVKAVMYYDPAAISGLLDRYRQYELNSSPQLKYGFLPQPDSYLQDMLGLMNEPCYFFMRLPQFGLLDSGEYISAYRMSPAEFEHLKSNFPPLMQSIESLPGNQYIRHLYCSSTIENMLLEKRRIIPALSAMNGRRVFLTSQCLVTQLKRIKHLLDTRKEFEVCFMPEEAFIDLSFHICSWGSSCVIGWIAGSDSAASKNANIAWALHDYCAKVWNRIPPNLRSRNAAKKKIDQWLRKAKMYGLDV